MTAATNRAFPRSSWRRLGAAVLGVTMLLAACGGGDDSAATTTLPAIPTTLAIQTAPPPTTAPAQLVKTGAMVVVANASRVNGAAGRMSKQLGDDGFTMGTPTNTGANLQRIEITKIYFIAGDAAAEAVANSLKVVLGGGSIEVTTMPTPAPTETGELEAGNTVLIALGNDAADKTLSQLQGGGTSTATTPSAGGGATTPATGSTATSTATSGATSSGASTTNPT